MNRVTDVFLRPSDLAERWGTSVGRLSNDRSAGRGVRYVRIGTRILYRLADVEAYEAARTVEPVGV